jgi:Ankyrin repeats (many copies)
MTQEQRPAQDTPQPSNSQQADSLVTSYHAAQYALDAEASEAGEGTAGPSAQTRANILAYAAQQPHVRAENASTDQQNATDSIAARAVNTKRTDQFDNKKPSANDGQWKLRALASVAIFGISGLLFMQWDRATPEEKQVAFSNERAAPSVASGATGSSANADVAKQAEPSAVAPIPAPAPAPAPTSAPEPSTSTAASALAKNSADSQTKEPRADAAPSATPPAVPSARSAITTKKSEAKADAKGSASTTSDKTLAETAPADAESTTQPKANQDSAKLAQRNDQAQAGAPAARTAPAGVPVLPAPAAAPAPVTTPAPAVVPAPASVAPNASLSDTLTALPRPAAAAPAARAKSTYAEPPANAGESSGATPHAALFAAIRAKDLAGLQQALANGADKNAKSGATPAIILCAQLGQVDMVRTLAAAGADVNATDAQGITALDHARGRGFSAVMDVLLKFGAR